MRHKLEQCHRLDAIPWFLSFACQWFGYMRVLLFTAGEIGSAVTLYGLGGFFLVGGALQ